MKRHSTVAIAVAAMAFVLAAGAQNIRAQSD